MSFQDYFRIVECWLYDKGYHIVLETDAQDCVYFGCKQVYLNSRNHIEKRLYILLHECGHILIDSCKVDRIYSLSRKTEAVVGKRVSKKRRVAVISEEVEAWKRGERLARKLQIPVDEEKFDKIRTDAIMSYVEWARD
jgi:hypothetical protein